MMNKKYFITILLFVFNVSFVTGENLIRNPGFEDNSGPRSKKILDWEIIVKYNVYEVWEKEYREGEYSVKFWWDGVIYQQFPTKFGSEYELSAWLCTPKSEPLDKNGSKFAVIELQFISSNKEIIATRQSKPFDKQKKIGKWYKLKVKGMAPPDSAFIRATIKFVGGKGDGVVCFDDVSLSLIREKTFSDYSYSQNLEGRWLIKKGDNLKWRKKDYDDSNWKKINVPSIWEMKYPDYNGFGWYRFHFKISENLKKEQLFLLLGTIDDADKTYLNGSKIGEYGYMAPHFQTAYNKKRIYEIPSKIIQYSQDNVLAVRVYDKMELGGIVKGPVKIYTAAGLKNYFKDVKQRAVQLGKPISSSMIQKVKKNHTKPVRCKIKKLPNGGWTFLLPNNKPFMPVGIEYEPLAMYGEMNWDLIKRDIKLIKDNGFNTFTVWCMDYNASSGDGIRMTIEEMVKLADLAKKNNLFIQYYLNSDRFIQIFPTAVLPDGQDQGFDIDYYNPDYRQFMRNFAKRLAVAFYPYDNVSTIVIWEEKIGLVLEGHKDKAVVQTFFGSKWGKAAFKKWLVKRHKTIQNLNTQWGTKYSSFKEAIDVSLLDYLNGVKGDDHRQYDILEFGTIMLIDFAKDFVDTYKSIDPSMLFQCRNWDLFGPTRAVDPRYSFLDSFGNNQYSLGFKGHDMTLREQIVKMKLIAGIVGIAPYVSNFGLRINSYNNTLHGLVPNENIKASLAADTLSAFSFLPEIIGTSYFTYFYKGVEGQWGIINDINGEPKPIYNSFKTIHSLMSQYNKEIAVSDYAQKTKVYIFHGLDAIYDNNVGIATWIENTTMGWDLTDMKIDYRLITDTSKITPSLQPIIIANYHVYDKKLDTKITKKLINYCRSGGTLIIGNLFGKYNRYLWPNKKLEKELQKLKGIKVSDLKYGKVKVVIPKKKYNLPDIKIDATWYVKGDKKTLAPGTKVLLEIEVDGKKQPGLICKKFGKGTVYYFLFNPYYYKNDWLMEEDQTNFNRTSLPILHFLFKELGIKHDTHFGNRGFNLKNGRINVYEQPIHYFVYKDVTGFGTFKDVYKEDKERYSGGVITDDFISFRGQKLKERGWNIVSSKVTSIYICIKDDKLKYSTSDPVNLMIKKGKWNIQQQTEKYKIYVSSLRRKTEDGK